MRVFKRSGLFCCMFVASCITSTNYRSAEHRLTDLSAYTLADGEWRTGTGVIGTGYDNLGVSVDVRRGLPGGVEVGTNAAQDLLGLVNADVGYQFLERPWGVLGLSVGIKWLNPKNIWLLPTVGEELGAMDIYMFPVSLKGSFELADWCDLHVSVGYIHSNVIGSVSAGSAVADGVVGAREAFIQPHFVFHAWDMAFILGSQIPVWAQGMSNAIAETPVAPGVVVGVASNEYQKLDVRDLNTNYLGAQWRWGTTNVRVTLVHGLRFLVARSERVYPAVDAYWRF